MAVWLQRECGPYIELCMFHPVLSGVLSQRKPFGTTIAGVVVQPEKCPQACLGQDRVCRIEIDVEPGNITT
jgi:hypothetical protein